MKKKQTKKQKQLLINKRKGVGLKHITMILNLLLNS